MNYSEERVPLTVAELKECCDCIDVTVPVIFREKGCKNYGIFKDELTDEYVVYRRECYEYNYRERAIYRGDEKSAVAVLYGLLKSDYDSAIAQLKFQANLKKQSLEEVKFYDPFYQMELVQKAMFENNECSEAEKPKEAQREKESFGHQRESSYSIKTEASHIYDNGIIGVITEKIKHIFEVIKGMR